MEVLYLTELAIPLYQVGLFMVISTLGLLFNKTKLALLTNYLFALYWGYWLNRETLVGPGIPTLDMFTMCYFGFGLVVVILAIFGFLTTSD